METFKLAMNFLAVSSVPLIRNETIPPNPFVCLLDSSCWGCEGRPADPEQKHHTSHKCHMKWNSKTYYHGIVNGCHFLSSCLPNTHAYLDISLHQQVEISPESQWRQRHCSHAASSSRGVSLALCWPNSNQMDWEQLQHLQKNTSNVL